MQYNKSELRERERERVEVCAPGKYFIRGAGKDEEESSGRRAEGATRRS